MPSDLPNAQPAPKRPGKEVKFWNDPAKRALLFQILLILVLGSFIWFIVDNTLNNLEQRGITTGFSFLDQEAGFGIPLSLIEYSEVSSYGRTFLVGLLNTVLVSLLGIIAATILGFILGVARLSDNWLIAKLSAIYIEIFQQYSTAAADLLLVLRRAAGTALPPPEHRVPRQLPEHPRPVHAGSGGRTGLPSGLGCAGRGRGCQLVPHPLGPQTPGCHRTDLPHPLGWWQG